MGVNMLTEHDTREIGLIRQAIHRAVDTLCLDDLPYIVDIINKNHPDSVIFKSLNYKIYKTVDGQKRGVAHDDVPESFWGYNAKLMEEDETYGILTCNQAKTPSYYTMPIYKNNIKEAQDKMAKLFPEQFTVEYKGFYWTLVVREEINFLDDRCLGDDEMTPVSQVMHMILNEK